MKKKNVLLLVLASFIMLSACGKKEQEQKPLTLSVLEAKKVPHANTYTFSGFTLADSTVEVRARVNGYIMERKFKEGDWVKRGQTLFQIEPYEYEANLKNAQAAVISGKSVLDKTSSDLARAENLFKNGNTSQSSYDTARTAYDSARAQLMQAEAALQIAELNIRYTRVEAPITGKISMSNFDAGNLVGPESGVLTTIVNADPIKVSIGISEGFLLDFGQYLTDNASLAKIDTTMRLRDGSLYEQPGRVSFFDVMVDTHTNTVTAQVEFPNPGKKLLPGQFVNIVIRMPVTENRIILPQDVVLTSQGRHMVMVVNKGKVEEKPVTMGQNIGTDVVIESGLEEGDLVITDMLQRIRSGMSVNYKIVNPEDSRNAENGDNDVDTDRKTGAEEGKEVE